MWSVKSFVQPKNKNNRNQCGDFIFEFCLCKQEISTIILFFCQKLRLAVLVVNHEAILYNKKEIPSILFSKLSTHIARNLTFFSFSTNLHWLVWL